VSPLLVAAFLVVSAALARPQQFLDTLRHPAQLTSSRAKESAAMKRRGVILRSTSRPVLSRVTRRDLCFENAGRPRTYQGRQYVEFTNSPTLTTLDPQTGQTREFMITRAVRAGATIRVLPSGELATKNYVSDELLFEIVDDQPRFRTRLLSSRPELNFLFEDARVSFRYASGLQKIYLSGTDYSPHQPGSTKKDVMNRYVELELDERGVPRRVAVDPRSGMPAFRDLSPRPSKRFGKTDAKNAILAENEQGQEVVRTRLRPDFKKASVRALAKGLRWKYAEQVFVFRSPEERERYDWSHALQDLFKPTRDDGKRVRPVLAKILLTDRDLVEHIDDPRVVPGRKGMGPGTAPVRLRRQGDELFISDGRGAPEHRVGVIPAQKRDGFPLAAGEVKYLSFDHEIRWLKQPSGERPFVKRHYSMAVKLFDDTLTNLEAYYADVVQPRRLYERGRGASIGDLLHVYAMGRTISNRDGKVSLQVYAGTSDAHTARYDFDVIKLLAEMGAHSPRRESGQVYTPGVAVTHHAPSLGMGQ
jgi:hypothetical protein